MDWQTPSLIAAGAGAIFLWARYMANKPRELGHIRYVPYTAVMFLALFVIILCLSYVVTQMKGL